ncbi:MAG: hypothetical protein SFV54_22405 [Bryobacteraceae bacterium]|nr:hypothetical protein [Bryobacteraceae bacterium]
MGGNRAFLLALAAAALMTGCFWRKARPAPKPFQAPVHAATVASAPMLEEPPMLATGAMPPEAPLVVEPSVSAPPFPVRTRPRRRVREASTGMVTTGPEPDESEAEEAAPPGQAAPLPILGALVPSGREREYVSLIDRLLQNAEGRMRGLPPARAASHRTNLERLRMFIRQARELRARNPEAAKAMAERADLLSRVITGEAR